jgi:Tfp pilus assembly protein PilO
MKASTKRILSIAFSGLFLVGALVVYGNFIKPTMETIGIRRGEIVSKEVLFSSKTQAVTEVKSIIDQLQNSGSFSDKVSLAIPRGASVTDALHQVYAIAKSNQVDLTDFSTEMQPFVSASSDQLIVKRLGSLAVTIGVRGEYQNLKAFLEGLETNIRVANVGDATIAPLQSPALQGGAPISNIYTLVVNVEMYFQE